VKYNRFCNADVNDFGSMHKNQRIDNFFGSVIKLAYNIY